MELQLKIEKEFEENPLLKHLGVVIHGSVYEAKQRAQQATSTGAAVTGTAATGSSAAGTATTLLHPHATKSHYKTVVSTSLLNIAPRVF